MEDFTSLGAANTLASNKSRGYALFGTEMRLRGAVVDNDKEENRRILKYIGEVLRADMKAFAGEPPPRAILLQVLHLIRREQELGGIELVSWDELPSEVRDLVERLKSGSEGPTEL